MKKFLLACFSILVGLLLVSIANAYELSALVISDPSGVVSNDAYAADNNFNTYATVDLDANSNPTLAVFAQFYNTSLFENTSLANSRLKDVNITYTVETTGSFTDDNWYLKFYNGVSEATCLDGQTALSKQNVTCSLTFNGMSIEDLKDVVYARVGGDSDGSADGVSLLLYEVMVSFNLDTGKKWDISENEGCVSFEPLGSCPETTFPLRPAVSGTNTIREDSSFIIFDFNSSNENISHIFKKSMFNTNGSAYWSPFHSTQYILEDNYKSDVTHLWGATLFDPYFKFLNGSVYVEKWAYEVRRNVTKYYIQGNNFIVVVNYTLLNRMTPDVWTDITDWDALTYNISIKGKSLQFNVQSLRSKAIKSAFDSVQMWNGYINVFNMENYSIDMENIMDIYLLNGSKFFATDVIWDKSDGSDDFSATHGYNINGSRANSQKGSLYNSLTNGSYNRFNESYYIVISSRVEDLFLYNKNPASSQLPYINYLWLNRIQGYDITTTWNYTQRLQNYGFDMSTCAVVGHTGTTENVERWNFTGSNTRAYISQLGQNLSTIGCKYSVYLNLQDVFTTSIFYNSSTHLGLNINGTNHSYIMRDSDGDLTDAWLSATYGQAKASRYDRRYDMLQFMWNNWTVDFKYTFLYLDTEGATLFSYIDYDSNASMKGMFRKGLADRASYFNWIKSQPSYDGENLFTTVENFQGFFTAGLIDSGVGRQCCENVSLRETIPDFTLSQMSYKQVLFSEYLAYYMLGWNGSSSSKYYEPRDNVEMDRYTIDSIVNRMNLHIDRHATETYASNVPENRTILLYYAMYPISKLYKASTISNSSYFSDTRGFMSLSTAILTNYSFNSSKIYQEYENNLRIYAYRNRTGWWNFTANSKQVNLAPNGLYAYMTDGSFEECYNCNNSTHYVINNDEGWVYIYPKSGSVNVSNLSFGYYDVYNYYGDDSSNGRRLVNQYTSKVSSVSVSQVSFLLNVSRSTFNFTLYDEDTLQNLSGQFINITVSHDEEEADYNTTNGTFFLYGSINGTYYFKFWSTNYTERTYTYVVDEDENTEENIYLTRNTNEVTFTIKDSATSEIVEGALIRMQRSINDDWQDVESHHSDVSGKAQFVYTSGERYQFIITHDDYVTKSFILDPILFSTYVVYVDSDGSFDNSQYYQGIRWGYTPTTFYNNQSNEFDFIISSPEGLLSSYGYEIIHPSGIHGNTGTTSTGETIQGTFVINGANIFSTVNITIWYVTSAGNTTISRTHSIIVQSGNDYTWASNIGETYGMGDFERTGLVVIVTIIIAGFASLAGGSLIGASVGLLVLGSAISIGFISIWAGLITFTVGVVILASRSGD